MLMQSAVPNSSPREQAFRKYPSVVPHLPQKSVRSSGDKEFRYASNFFIPTLYRKVQDTSTLFYRSVFYGKANPHNDCGMDTVAIRRQRLKALIRERYKGIQANMVRDTGINAGELSALMRDKYFGEKKARALEKQLGLPDLWFDGIESQPDDLVESVKWIMANGEDRDKELLANLIDSVKVQIKPGIEQRTQELKPIRDRRKKA